MTLHVPFDNSYARLPDRFYARLAPTPVPGPRLLALNEPLARDLGLDPAALAAPQGVAMLAGNDLPDGAEPIAQAYAGHQFGGFVPQLGDGRAILLGEVVGGGARRDIQLKGAGRTPFSRMGDGRAWIGPVLREYLVSEAMAAMGIPTTRALAAVTTGAEVLRERAYPGAVLTRVAASHIRVGTFQYFAAREDTEALQALTDHAIARHWPDAGGPLDLLSAVVAAQADLVAAWMSVGFIHGVMNTDNMAISGETIDYGPCAFMDSYHPDTVFSSIDRGGRYAYRSQPDIAMWNLAQLASALLPLIPGDQQAAIDAATERLNRFPELYREAWLARFRAKLGLERAGEADESLIVEVLRLMAEAGADFTLTFRALAEDGSARAHLGAAPGCDDWHERWQARLTGEGARPGDRAGAMAAANPAVIPRNHRVEEAIAAAVDGDMAPFERLLSAVTRPFAPAGALAEPPAPGQEVQATFCGT